MKEKKDILNFSILLFLSSSSYALINVQVIPFLTNIGYTASQRGMILSVSAFLSIIGQLYTGYLSDKYRTIKRFFMAGTAILIVTAALGYAMNDYNYLYHFIFISLATSIFRVCSNMLETWILRVKKVRNSFGLIRGTGSVGWALTSLLSAFIILKFGYRGVALVFTIVSIMIIVQAQRINDIDKTDETAARLQMSDVKNLVINKNYVQLIVVFTLANLVMNADSILVTDYIFELGGTEYEVGLRWLIQGLVELPAFYFGTKLIGKLGGKKFVWMTLGFLMLRFVLYSQATSINQIILISLLQMVTFPFLITAQRFLIDDETPGNLKNSGQMLASSIIMSISSIITPLIAGSMSQYFDYQTLLLLFGLFVLVPIISLIGYRKDV